MRQVLEDIIQFYCNADVNFMTCNLKGLATQARLKMQLTFGLKKKKLVRFFVDLLSEAGDFREALSNFQGDLP